MSERLESVYSLFTNTPARALLELMNRLAIKLNIDHDTIDTALLSIWDDIETEMERQRALGMEVKP